jgi:outer membrane protein assembly factor BamB
MKRFSCIGSGWTALCAVVLIAALGTTSRADRFDWPNWRGPWHNNSSLETGLVSKWNAAGGAGSNLLWKSAELGTRSTPIVMDGRLYTICRHLPNSATEQEKVVCADAATGKILWENRFNVYLSDVPAERIGWSCCAGDPATGNIYVLGVSGLFQCLDGKTGKTLWRNSMHEQFGLLTTYGGRTNVPVIFEDLVIIGGVVIGWGEQARPNHRYLAFDRKTGAVVWFQGTKDLPNDTNYSTPVLTVIDGQWMMIVGAGDGQVWAFQPRTGRPIWHYNFTMGGINVSPLVVGDTVFVSHSEENLDASTAGAVAAIKANLKGNISETGQLWKVKELMVGRSSPVWVDDRLLCIDDRAKLFVLDPKSGDTIYRKALGKECRATPLVADGKVYCITSNGSWFILEPTESGMKELSKGRLPTGEECHGSPIVSAGRIYFPSTEHLWCIGTANHKPAMSDPPSPPAETPADQDQKPAHVQVVPAEVLLRPGQSQEFAVRLFNARGQRLASEKVQAKFTVSGAGTIDDAGKFTASESAAHSGSILRAQVGELTGAARIRVVPDLPWKFDFESGEIPLPWVGARYRHVIRKIGDNTVAVKITTIPKGTRSQCFFGHTDLSNYTITADVMGDLKDNKMPDIGVIAQGYIFALRGAYQEVQIRTWGTQTQRMNIKVPFPWKPKAWYTMKFTAATENGKAVLRGKVWPKGGSEPDTWNAELTDPAPVEMGSPGLWADATDAEIFLDNIAVTSSSPK